MNPVELLIFAAFCQLIWRAAYVNSWRYTPETIEAAPCGAMTLTPEMVARFTEV